MPAERLSALDIAFLCLEDQATPMHMGGVMTFRPRTPLDPCRLAALVAERAARIPKLRQRVRPDWTPLGGARWEEDPAFDPARHVGVHDIGGRDRPDPLAEFASGWIAAPLDLDAPLWNLELVSGLPGGEFAILLKLHHALADGAGAVEVASALFDDAPALRGSQRAPSEPATSPLDRLFRRAYTALGEAAGSARIASAIVRAARPYPMSPTMAGSSPSRRLGFVRIDLSDIKKIRKAHGGTANDVVLAVLAGALREWLLNRGRYPDSRPLRALIPVSLRRREAQQAGGNALSGYLCELPTDLDDPLERLHSVRCAMERNKKAGPARGAGAIPVLANRLPCGVHRVAAKIAGHGAPLLFDTVVTNVPLRAIPMSLGGATLREVYPFVPLAPHQAVGVAVSTYRDAMHIGLQVNGAAVPDVGSLADAVTKSLGALSQRCA